MNPSNGASGKIHKFVSKKHNQKINYKKNICNMKHVKNFFGSTVILLSVLFVRCSNNISDRDIESNKQKSQPQYITNSHQSIDSYLVEEILPLYDKIFNDDDNINLEEAVEKYSYYINNYNIIEAIKNSKYYKSYSNLSSEKLMELYNKDYPYFVYHAIKSEGSPKIRKLLNTIDTNAVGFSTIDSIIYSSKYIYKEYKFPNIIRNGEFPLNEYLFLTQLYVINNNVLFSEKDLQLLPKWICEVIRFIRRGMCLSIDADTEKYIVLGGAISGTKGNNTCKEKPGSTSKELEDCYKSADLAYEDCIKEKKDKDKDKK